jgi:tetratricopeptide (TPR) repeat protein
MAQDAVTRLGREALSQYTRDELIDLADRELARTADPLVFLAEASRHEAALDDRIASLYERALRSPCSLVRFHAAWCVYETRACWARFIKVLQAAREAEDDESNRENIDVVIDLLQTELRDEEEERIRWAHPGLARVEYDVTRRRALSGEELTSLEQAVDFLRMPYDIYHWYSERSLNMSLERALASLQKLERWWDEIAPSFQSEAPYEHSDPFMDGDSIHPLGAYIISSQFLWHYHGWDQAERHLLRSLHLAETLVTRGRGGAAPVMPRAPLKERYLDNVSRAYHDPRLYTVNHFYLGELYERRGAHEQAAQHYARFAELEPDFSPRNSYACHPDYYDTKRFYPGTVEAYGRLGNLYRDRLGNPDRARFYYEKALRLSPSHHTPYREVARLLEQADPRGALDLLRQEIETLSSYPDPDPSPNSRCLPFEPREVVERFRAWRSHPMAPRHEVDVVARSVLRFLKGLSVEPYRFAYAEWNELAQQVESASSPSA